MHVTALGKVKFRGAWYANATPIQVHTVHGVVSKRGVLRIPGRTMHTTKLTSRGAPASSVSSSPSLAPNAVGVSPIFLHFWRIAYLVHNGVKARKGMVCYHLTIIKLETFTLYILTCYCRSLLYSVIACISSSPVLSVCLRICILAW